MEQNPSISVIMPVYNTPKKYLKKAIDSVLNQTFKSFELIIVNSSTDDSEELILDYDDSRIKYIVQNKGGQSKARNIGLKTAKGKYIYYIDADDWIEKNTFEKMFNHSEKWNYDILISNAVDHNIKTKEYKDWAFDFSTFFKESTIYDINDATLSQCIFAMSPTPWGKLYKKNFLLENELFFIEDVIFEDLELYFRYMIKAKKIGFVADKFYYYRTFVENSSTTNGDRRHFSIIKVLNLIKKTLIENNLYDKQRIKFYDFVIDLLKHRYTLINIDLQEEFKSLIRAEIQELNISKRDFKKLNFSDDFLKFFQEIGVEI